MIPKLSFKQLRTLLEVYICGGLLLLLTLKLDVKVEVGSIVRAKYEGCKSVLDDEDPCFTTEGSSAKPLNRYYLRRLDTTI